MKIILLLAVAGICGAQTSRFDYPTQVRNGPIFSDAAAAGVTLAQLCTTAGTGTLSITKQWTGLTTQTVTCALAFNGGSLRPASGQTVTLGPSTVCPSSRTCFDISAGGSIAFTTPPAELSLVNMGADLTGISDSSAILVAAVNAVAKDGQITIPCGTFKFNSEVTWPHSTSLKFAGSSKGCVHFVWGGGTGVPMFHIPNCYICEFSGFTFDGSASHPLTYLIQTENDGTGSPTPTKNTFRNININGNAYLGTAFYLGGTSDNNNDQQLFDDMEIIGYTHAAFTINGFNVLNVVINHTGCIGGGGLYCVEALHGSFVFENGDIGSNATADFYIAAASTAGYRLINIESEGSAAFLTTNVSSGERTEMEIANVDWADNCLGNTDPAQVRLSCPAYTPVGDAIHWGFVGPVNIHDNHFGISGTANNLTVYCAFSRTHDGLSGCRFNNNIFSTSNTTVAALMGTFGQYDSFVNGSHESALGVYTDYPDIYAAPATVSGAYTFSAAPTFPSYPTVSWTPAITFGGGSTGLAYAARSGSYFRVGDLTYFTFSITMSAKGSSTGVALITGLPSTATFGGPAEAVLASNFSGVTVPVIPNVISGASYISLTTQDTGSGTGAGGLSDTQFTNTSTLYGWGWYK